MVLYGTLGFELLDNWFVCGSAGYRPPTFGIFVLFSLKSYETKARRQLIVNIFRLVLYS